VGKSKLCEALIQSRLKLEWIDIDQFFKQFHCYARNDMEEFNVVCDPKVCINLRFIIIYKYKTL